jgi:hypothetical protein
LRRERSSRKAPASPLRPGDARASVKHRFRHRRGNDIYIPAIANYRDNWLRQRLSAAYTAALVLDAAPRAMVPPGMSRQLLDSVGARLIVLSKHGTKRISPRHAARVDGFTIFASLLSCRCPTRWPR